MRNSSLLCAVLAVCSTGAVAAEQSYPVRPVRIIAPFTPGSGVDIVARAIAASLNAAWNQSVIVENRAGAGGTIAGELVAKGNADGYTLMRT